MGKKIESSITCLILGYLKLFFAHYEHSTPILYKRCIDDIVGSVLCSEEEQQCSIDHMTNFNLSIKYTCAILDNTATFLDLQLTMNSNHIK